MNAPTRKLDFSQAVLCRGMSREVAARYIGIGATKFDEMVLDGRMPQPKRVDGRKVWDRFALDESFEALPSAEEINPWAR